MNKIKFICFTLFLWLQIFPVAAAVDYNSIESEPLAPEVLDSAINETIKNSTTEVITPYVEDLKEMTPNANVDIKNEVLNDTSNAFKFTIKKFLFAMIGVLISSLVIFAVLSLMNKINNLSCRALPVSKKDEDELAAVEEIPAPNSENEALRVFFEKTQ